MAPVHCLRNLLASAGAIQPSVFGDSIVYIDILLFSDLFIALFALLCLSCFCAIYHTFGILWSLVVR